MSSQRIWRRALAGAVAMLGALPAAGQKQVSPTGFAGATVCSTACVRIDVFSYTLQDYLPQTNELGFIDVLTLRFAALQGRSPLDGTVAEAISGVRVAYDATLPLGPGGSFDATLVPTTSFDGANVPAMPVDWYLQRRTQSANNWVSVSVPFFSRGISGCSGFPAPFPLNDEWPGVYGNTCPPGSAVQLTYMVFDPPVVGAFDASKVRAFGIDAVAWGGEWFKDEVTGVSWPVLSDASCFGCEVYDFHAGVIPLTPVPEPAPLVSLGTGALAIGALALRRRRARAS